MSCITEGRLLSCSNGCRCSFLYCGKLISNVADVANVLVSRLCIINYDVVDVSLRHTLGYTTGVYLLEEALLNNTHSCVYISSI
jgi:hypothetical protein